jgi:hypothetical protein
VRAWLRAGVCAGGVRGGLPMRNVVLGGVLAVVLAGCRSQTKTVAVVKAVQPVTAAPTPIAATAARLTERGLVPDRVSASVEKSVLPVYCHRPNAWDDFTGTGFIVARGFATALHEVAACPAGVTIPFGPATDLYRTFSGTASIADRTHDLALVTDQSLVSSRPPLRPESASVYVGEPLALIGMPGLSAFSSFQNRLEVVRGTVVATNRTVQLRSSAGGARRLPMR